MSIDSREIEENHPLEISPADLDAHFGVAPAFRLLEEAKKYLPSDWSERFNHFRVDFKNGVLADDRDVAVRVKDTSENIQAEIAVAAKNEVARVVFNREKIAEWSIPSISPLPRPVERAELLAIIPQGEAICLVDRIVAADKDQGAIGERMLTAADLADGNLVFKMVEMIGQTGSWFLLGGPARAERGDQTPILEKDRQVAMFTSVTASFDFEKIKQLIVGEQLSIAVSVAGEQEGYGLISDTRNQPLFRCRFGYTKPMSRRAVARLVKLGRNQNK